MNYSETLQYLFNRLPMYQRVGGAAYKADLSNTIRMCEMLGHPDNKFKSVHVAGTNGKGSTSNMLASVLQESGYKTGLYTSPHYKDFRERIRINGEMIPENRVVDFVEIHKATLEAIDLSFFEMTVGMAFQYFAEEKVDIAVVEVGMGGRLDSTNLIVPIVSVITNIGMDHMHFLGNSLPEIAAEKAGIIKTGIPLVIGETQPEVQAVFTNTATMKNAPISFADQKWKVEISKDATLDVFNGKDLWTNLNFTQGGKYQHKNLTTVMEAVSILQNTGIGISMTSLKNGLENLRCNTGFKGRWQILGTTPLIIADSGHNRDGIAEVMKNIHATPYEKLHFVLGVVNDKCLDGMLELLPKQAAYYFCKADIPRGLPAGELAEKALPFGLTGNVFPSVQKALEAARTDASASDLVFIGGSTFVVAEVLD
ncbi:MAG: bifunctional folylpolyglutamate synthase/dihydrofolate synthase [Bacteroidales bacterium]|nr:bifunctional folylpolyglutamate synthase/dihydrofolate synthase [Bacteroidales bacterium]